MRKKVLNGKRVMALALALSLTVGEAGVAVAAPVDAEQTETVAVDVASEEAGVAEQEADVTVSANEGEVNAPEGEQPTEDDIDADEKVDGTLSKVIGLEASELTAQTINGNNGNTVLRYVQRNTSGTKFEVPGKLEQQKEYPEYYIYNGKYYDDADYSTAKNTTTLYTGNEMTAVAGQPENFKDPNTGLYVINGMYFAYLASDDTNVYYNVNNQIIPAAAMSITLDQYTYEYYEIQKLIQKTYGVYTDGAVNEYSSPRYYNLNGRLAEWMDFKEIGENEDAATGKVTYSFVPYISYRNEMLADANYVRFTWNDLDKPVGAKNAAGQELSLSYEVEVNGTVYNKDFTAYDAAGATHQLLNDRDGSEESKQCFDYEELLTNGQAVTVRVRGVYYHEENKVGTREDGTQVGEFVDVIDSFGEWSEPVSYTYTAPQNISAVSAVSATYVKGETTINGASSSTADVIRGSFATVPQAKWYSVYRIASKKAVTLDASNFADVYAQNYRTLQQLGLSGSDITCMQTGSNNGTFTDEPEKGYSYYYYAVVPYAPADAIHYVNTQTLRTIAAIGTTTIPEEANTLPQVTNLRVEKYADGSKALVWDKLDKDVVIYAYEASNFPAYYTVDVQNPVRTEKITEEDGDTYEETSYMRNDLSDDERLALNKVRCAYVDGNAGRYTLQDDYSQFSMKPGRTYYFVAYTYDSAKRNSNQTPLTYSGTKKTIKNGVETVTPVTYNYYTYTPISAASAVVAVKAEMNAKPYVRTLAAKNSVKLTMQYVSGTGYEIYRKSGKKFKKIATTNSDVYTDEGLKANTTYTYKVRAYYYNRDTKEKYYSDYGVVSVKTADAANIDVIATKSSKTAVKVSWTKVANAAKYEVYRSNSENADPKVFSKKYSANGIKTTLQNNRYELVKTLSKSKKSYTDKKLTAGETYTYVVIAYYKTGSKTECVTDSDSVYLGMDTSVAILDGVISGSKAKITWVKDKYASKYEVEYTVYDVNGNPKSSQPVKATTKKTSYIVSGLAAGEYVSVRIRAVGKGNVYSDWSDVEVVKKLAPVKGIKAVTASKKNAAGQTVKGVKITWKAVAGAKYYKVYRSTKEGNYDKDAKVYDLPSDNSAIVKEANDNFWTNSSSLRFDGGRSDDTVPYKEYKEIEDSVVGTTAYDYADFPAGVTYYYTVVAYGEAPVDGNDSNVCSNQVVKAAKVTANGIDAVTVKNSKKGKVTVTFNTVPGAKKYTVYRSMKKGGKYTKVATVKVTKKNKSKKALSYTGKAVKKKTYYYKVVAEGTNELKADMNIESAVKKIKVKK